MVTLSIHLKPGSSRNAIGHPGPDGKLAVQVHARPIDNGANEALVTLLAKALHCAPSLVRIKKGHQSRHKTVEIDNITIFPEELYGKSF